MVQWVTDNRKIGILLTVTGVIFLLLGVLTFFDKALLSLGNLMFIFGVVLLIGVKNVGKFFLNPDKIRGTLCFSIGMVMVLVAWPIIGMSLELFGVFNLFGNFFPMILAFLRKVPGISIIFNAPYISRFFDWLVGDNVLIGE